MFNGQYLSYNEFKALNYSSSLEQMPFNLLETQARKIIDKYTFGRVKGLSFSNIPAEVKICDNELILLLNNINNGVQNSGNAVNYSEQEIERQEHHIVKNYLSNVYLDNDTVPLLYRG